MDVRLTSQEKQAFQFSEQQTASGKDSLKSAFYKYRLIKQSILTDWLRPAGNPFTKLKSINEMFALS